MDPESQRMNEQLEQQQQVLEHSLFQPFVLRNDSRQSLMFDARCTDVFTTLRHCNPHSYCTLHVAGVILQLRIFFQLSF